MIECLGDLVSLIALVLLLIMTIIVFYNGLVSHREQLFQRREETYYRLLDEADDSEEFDDRDEPYYED